MEHYELENREKLGEELQKDMVFLDSLSKELADYPSYREVIKTDLSEDYTIKAMIQFLQCTDIGCTIRNITKKKEGQIAITFTNGDDATVETGTGSVAIFDVLKACIEHTKKLTDSDFKSLIDRAFCQCFMREAVDYGMCAGMSEEEVRTILCSEKDGKSVFSKILDELQKINGMPYFSSYMSCMGNEPDQYIQTVIYALLRNDYIYKGTMEDEYAKMLPQLEQDDAERLEKLYKENKKEWLTAVHARMATKKLHKPYGISLFYCKECGEYYYPSQMRFVKGQEAQLVQKDGGVPGYELIKVPMPEDLNICVKHKQFTINFNKKSLNKRWKA